MSIKKGEYKISPIREKKKYEENTSFYRPKFFG
jgi:hypothetical protein